jgi:hypothetical protein
VTFRYPSARVKPSPTKTFESEPDPLAWHQTTKRHPDVGFAVDQSWPESAGPELRLVAPPPRSLAISSRTLSVRNATVRCA